LQILNRDRELLAAMSRRAQATAADQSWMSYRTNFADTLGAVAACK